MANQPWLDEVRAGLVGHALPPAYIRRFMDELYNRFQDIMEENMSTEAGVLSRLGEPSQVAKAAVTAYRRRSFLGRHPVAAFLVFGVSPIVSLILVFVLNVLGIAAIFKIFEPCLMSIGDPHRTTPPGPVGLAATDYLFSLLYIIIPAVLTTVLYCKLAKWLGVARAWMVASCVVLAIMVIPCWHTTVVGAGPGVVVELWIPGLHGQSWMPPSILPPLLQILVPVAIGWWFMRRTRDQGRLQLAS